MRLIDADVLCHRMYIAAFETDSDMQKWDSGCWIRYMLFQNVLDEQPTIEPEPEIYFGYTPTHERPLADREIIPRLRDIQKQVGGSYAIDRAIEIIEEVAERAGD